MIVEELNNTFKKKNNETIEDKLEMITKFCIEECVKLPKINKEQIDLLKKEFKEDIIAYAIKELNSSSAGRSYDITTKLVKNLYDKIPKTISKIM